MSEADDLQLKQLQWGQAVGIMTITCSDCQRTNRVGDSNAPIIEIVKAAREQGWSVVPAPDGHNVVNFCPTCVGTKPRYWQEEYVGGDQ